MSDDDLPEWTPELDSALREHVAAGGSLTAFAKAHDFNKGHASRRAKLLGLLLTHGTPPAATTAVQQSVDDAREALARMVLVDALNIRERMWESETVTVSTPIGLEDITYEYPTAKSLAEFTSAINHLAKVHENITRIGAARSSDVARSAILKLQDDLRAALDTDPESEAPDVDG